MRIARKADARREFLEAAGSGDWDCTLSDDTDGPIPGLGNQGGAGASGAVRRSATRRRPRQPATRQNQARPGLLERILRGHD